MSQTLSSLARMTLRQLRQVASELGVTLYSRKTKDELVSAIGERQADLSSLEQEHVPLASWMKPAWCFCLAIPNGPTCSGRSAKRIGSKRSKPVPASCACAWPM